MYRVVAAAGAVLAGCLADPEPAVFTCFTDRQCTAAVGSGFCEASGACSFSDSACPGGRRYGAHTSADRATHCVDETLTTSLVGNGDFEEELVGWAGSKSTLARSDVAHSLDHAALVCASSTELYGITDEPSWVTSPKQAEEYEARAWVRAPPDQPAGQTVVMFVRERPTASSYGMEVGSARFPLSQEWQLLTATSTVTQDLYALDLYLYVTDISSGSVGCFLLDDVSAFRIR